MDPSRRIVINTGAQYAKAIINTVLALYSTRLILEALSFEDYGIYSVVGGVVAMLGFITNALIITTQRHISFSYGKNDPETVQKFFTSSLFLHLVFGLIITIILLLLKDWLFQDILNISPTKKSAASIVYVITIFMLFFTVLTSPFKAVFIARENIIFIALVEVADAILKLFIAWGLSLVNSNHLVIYSFLMLSIVILNFAVFAIWALRRFEECSISTRRHLDRDCLLQLLGFAGWTTYGMGAVACRNQGTAIILNHFFGSVINAAYGIAFQLYGAIAFVVTSIMNAMNPQIMASEGANDRVRMLRISCMESKYSSTLLALVIIPLVFEMNSILTIWLHNVPQDTAMICRYILVSFIFDQTTMGLQTAIQATGKIRSYTLLIYTPKLLFLPFVWILLQNTCNTDAINLVMMSYIIVEALVAFIRLPYAKMVLGLDLSQYVREIFFPLSATSVACCMGCLAGDNLSEGEFAFIPSSIIGVIAGLLTFWWCGMSVEEKALAKQMSSHWRNWRKE